jgi:aminocarboxymuconate-semialdehyde decarboxylase
MSSRREFLKGLTSATAGTLVHCGLVNSAFALMQNQQQSAVPRQKRREVFIGGRRVLTIDVHAHIQFPDIWKLIPKDYPVPRYLEQQAQTYRTQTLPTFNARGPEVDKLLSDMDEMGLDMRAMSINPPPYWAVEPDLARQLVRLQNEKLAELAAAHPDRFVGLGSLALQHPVLAVEQMEEGVTKLGMRGFLVGGSVNGEELSGSKFHLVWAKAEQLGTLLFLHPWGFNGIGDLMPGQPRFGGNGQLGNVIGNPLETTIALSHLIQDGIFDLFPNLKLCAAHGGGFLPNYASRSDRCLTAFPNACKPLKKKPSEYLKQLYYDSLLFTPEGLRHLIAEVGVSQIMVGTDGTRWNHEAVDRVLVVPGLSDADRIAILGGTAAKLLRIGP